MTIYLVRWPELKASLVQADDEDELVYKLDEVADPGGCTWQKYEGPLWIDFELPVDVDFPRTDSGQPLTKDKLKIDVEELVGTPWSLTAHIPEGDTGGDMKDAVRRGAFPTLDKLIDDAEEAELLSAEEIQSAVEADLVPLLEYYWRCAQVERRDDPQAEIMKQLGVSIPMPSFSPADGDED